MKLKELKKYIEIYYKRVAKRRRQIEKEEILMLWGAIKSKAIKEKNLKKKTLEKKKLEYDDED